MPDSILRSRIEIVGVREALADYRDLRTAMQQVSTTGATARVSLDDTTARARLAEFRAETQRLNAVNTRLKVDADTQPAVLKLRAVDTETKNLVARRNLMRLELDNTPALLSLRQYEAETKRIQAQQRGSGGGGGSIRGAISSEVGGGIAGGAVAGGAILAGGLAAKEIKDTVAASIDLNSKLQQANITFTTFLGSEQAAQEHLQELQRFAATTPFQFPDLVDASRRLQAMGFSAKEVIPDLRAIGGAVSALGTGTEGINRITLALGQMQQKGKVTGEELRQLQEAGIDATGYIAKALETTTADVLAKSEKGQISGRTGVNAIISGLAADPRFAGLLEAQSRSFAGAMSNIQDSAQMALAQGLKPLFEALNDGATALAKFTSSETFTKGAEQFAQVLHEDIEAIKTLSAEAKNIADPFLPLIDTATKYTVNLRTVAEALNAVAAITNQIHGQPYESVGSANVDTSSVNALMGGGAGARFLQNNAASSVISGLTTQVREGAITADQAQKQWDALVQTFGALYGNVDAVSALFSTKLAQATKDATANAAKLRDEQEQYQANLKEMAKYQGLGANPEDISRAIFGVTGTGDAATTGQIKRAQDALNALDQQQKQLETDTRSAWQSMAQAVAGFSSSQGLRGIANLSTDLQKANAELARVGQTSTATSGLAKIADQFQAIADAEDAASSSLKGYQLTLTETDRRIQQLQAFRGQIVEAVQQADKDRGAGVATPQELDLLNKYQPILTNIDTQIRGLQSNKIGDLLGIADAYPDLKAFDDTSRDLVSQYGGGKNLQLTLQADTKDASDAINAIVNPPKPYETTVRVNYINVDGSPAGTGPVLGPPSPGGAGYARPTTIRSTGGGPYGNDTLTQGGAGGGGLGYQPLSQAQYGQIVSSGPLANPQVYAGVMAAAQKYGVDPRLLLAFVKNEGVAPSLAAVNNFGGIKGTGGPAAPANEGGTYAAYSSPQAFFEELARLITQGDKTYASGFASGDLGAIRQHYVAGNAPPSSAQQANIANTVSNYNQLTQQYPGGGTDDVPSGVVSNLRQQIVQKALQSVGQDKLVNLCEQFVEETVQAITGQRGATGKNELSANAALATAKQKGLVTTNPQPGDLVYYGDAQAGHVAIYMGNGKQISTYDKGNVNDPEARKIHIEPVGAGAQYVRVPGLSDGPAGSNVVGNAALAAAGGLPHPVDIGATTAAATSSLGTTNLTSPISGAAGGLHEAGQAAREADSAVGKLLATLNSQDLSASLSKFQEMRGVFDQIAQAKFPNEPIRAADDALQQGIGFLGAWAQALQAIRGQTDGLAAAQQKITEIVGGPMAANLNSQLDHMNTLSQIHSHITDLTQQRKELESQHNATLASRQQQDSGIQRAQQQQQFIQGEQDRARQRQRQAQQNDIQDQQNAANDAWTNESRIWDDRIARLQHYGTDRFRQLSNEKDALEALKKSQDALNRSQELNLAGNLGLAFAHGGPNAARDASARLSITRLSDANAADQRNTRLDAVNDLLAKEQKVASDQLFDLEQQRTAASRAHEDRMTAIERESEAEQRAAAAQDDAIAGQRAAQQEADAERANALEDQRAAEDAAYQQSLDSIDAQIQQYQALADTEQQALDALTQAFNLMTQGGSQIAQILGSAVSSAGAAQGFLDAQPVGGGSIRRLGGKAAGGFIPVGGSALTGDAAGGVATPFTEEVKVTPQGAVVTPLANRPSASGGGDITINIGGDTILSAQALADIRRYIEQKKREAITEARQAVPLTLRGQGRVGH